MRFLDLDALRLQKTPPREVPGNPDIEPTWPQGRVWPNCDIGCYAILAKKRPSSNISLGCGFMKVSVSDDFGRNVYDRYARSGRTDASDASGPYRNAMSA